MRCINEWFKKKRNCPKCRKEDPFFKVDPECVYEIGIENRNLSPPDSMEFVMRNRNRLNRESSPIMRRRSISPPPNGRIMRN